MIVFLKIYMSYSVMELRLMREFQNKWWKKTTLEELLKHL